MTRRRKQYPLSQGHLRYRNNLNCTGLCHAPFFPEPYAREKTVPANLIIRPLFQKVRTERAFSESGVAVQPFLRYQGLCRVLPAGFTDFKFKFGEPRPGIPAFLEKKTLPRNQTLPS